MSFSVAINLFWYVPIQPPVVSLAGAAKNENRTDPSRAGALAILYPAMDRSLNGRPEGVYVPNYTLVTFA